MSIARGVADGLGMSAEFRYGDVKLDEDGTLRVSMNLEALGEAREVLVTVKLGAPK